MTTKTLLPPLIALVAAVMTVQAQTNQNPQIALSPGPSSFEQNLNDIKNPTPWLSWGGDLRLRNEYFNNAQSLTTDPAFNPLFAPVHEQDYFRFRGRVWTSITPVECFSLNARLSAEPRDFMKPSSSDTFFGQQGMQWRYGIFDNLNVQWRKPLDLPTTVTVGRQDIFLADGWLVGDGTPLDGSFTYFLDSARITWELKDQKTTIDAIGIIQDARPDGWLPTVGTSTGGRPGPFLLTDQNEKGAILWVANKCIPTANLDGFFIYKKDELLNSAPKASFGDNADIFTIGGQVSGLVQEHFKYSAEGAYQFGRKQDAELNQGGANPTLPAAAQTTGYRDISAFGVQAKATYLFKDKLNDQVSLSYEFLSGDNPNTKNDEMFDVLWGRWPSWSEMYNVYSPLMEARIAQSQNLHRIGPTWSIDPFKDLNFSASYYALLADQSVVTRNFNNAKLGALGFTGPAPFTDTGTFRGHYLQAVVKYKFSKHVSGHLWGEVLFPGDFYASRQTMSFLRAELMFTL